MIYYFEDCELDTVKARLLRDGIDQNIEPQVYSLLEILVSQNDRIVSKQEIVDHVWNNRNTSNASIDTRVRSARQAIGDNGQDQRLIKTFKNQGFRFIGAVTIADASLSFTQRFWSGVNSRPRLAFGGIIAVLIALVFAVHTLSNGSVENNAHQLQSTESVTKTSSIAVLPFKDISTADDQMQLANGFTEEMMNALMYIDGLKVSSRTSVDIFARKQLPVDNVADILDVAHILEGSLRREGEVLRISVRLIDTKTDKQLWNKVYDRTLQSANLFEIQNDISRNVASNLTTKLDLSNFANIPQTTVLEAYEIFLIGRTLEQESTPESFKSAVEAFQKVLKIDAQYAPAHIALMRNYYRMNRYGLVSEAEAREAMELNLRAAQAIAPGSREVLRAAGIMADFNNRPEEALKLFDELVEQAPNYGDAHMSRGIVLSALGRLDEALEAYKTALKFDPLSPVLLSNLQILKLGLGDLPGAIETAQVNIRWNDDNPETQSELAYLYLMRGDYAQAHNIYLRVLEKNPEDYKAQYDVSAMYRDIGRQDLAIKVASHPNVKAIGLAFAGDFEGARAIASKNPSDHDHAFALHITGQDKYALQLMRENIAAFKILDPDTMIAVNDYSYLVDMAFILQRHEDPGADQLLERLEKIFTDRPLNDYQTSEEFRACTGYYLIRKDTSKALGCLDEAIDRGFAMLQLTQQPVFAALENQPGYKKRYARMEENAKRHHQFIDRQISNR